MFFTFLAEPLNVDSKFFELYLSHSFGAGSENLKRCGRPTMIGELRFPARK
jgi:hypothetical protein